MTASGMTKTKAKLGGSDGSSTSLSLYIFYSISFFYSRHNRHNQ